MTKKDLRDKAIKIKGKDYVLVSDRILFFNDNYPGGKITTNLLSELGSDRVVFKSWAFPDAKDESRVFTGHSQARWGEGPVNETSALENAETSSVGRALAMMGIGVLDSVASVDEMNKAGVKYDPKPTNNAEVKCSACGSRKEYKEGISKKGYPYALYKCTNAKCGEVGWTTPKRNT